MIPLIIFADSGSTVGAGHAMRSLAIAEDWIRRGGKVSLCCSQILPTVRALAEISDIEVRLWEAEGFEEAALVMIGKVGPVWIWVDGYSYSDPFLVSLEGKSDCFLAMMDDVGHRGRYFGDLLVNQNPYACESHYYGKVSERMALLLGANYLMLRNEFTLGKISHEKEYHDELRILLTLGGGATEEFVLQILEAIKIVNTETAVDVVVIANNLEQETFPLANGVCRIIPQQNHFSKWLAWSDMGITASGVSLWEFLHYGIPCLAGVLADNQQKNAEWLSRKGLIEYVGDFRDWDLNRFTESYMKMTSDEALRNQYSIRGEKFIDGQGRERIIETMLEIEKNQGTE